MILKYGIRKQDNSDNIKTITIDNITSVIEESEKTGIVFVRSVGEKGREASKVFLDFETDKNLVFGYLMNDRNDTLRVLKYRGKD